MKRKTANVRLKEGSVRVNDKVVTRATHEVAGGDVVIVGRERAPRALPLGMRLIKEDERVLAIDKPNGLLSVPADRPSRSAQSALEDHLGQKLFVVHRIDRETSGVLLFAKDQSAQNEVMSAWREAEKVYLAVVRGGPEEDRGVIDLPLRELKSRAVVVDEKMRGTRDARTRFVVERRADGMSLLRVDLETGRKHQIRVHLAHLGCPVVDDARYDDARGTGRLLLHALSLNVLDHHFEAPIPRGFLPAALR